VSNDQLKAELPLILAIETATRAGGVAVARGEKVLASTHGDPAVSHSANLLEMIQSVLARAGSTLRDVDLFSVAVGPGSFTGLRIGLATVKAFAVHLRGDVVAVPTLAAVAHASKATGNVVALLPAGRGEVFAQRYEISDGMVTSLDEPRHLSPEAVVEECSGVEGLQWVGEGTRMLAGHLPTLENETALITELELAPSVAVLALRAFKEGKAVPPEDLQAVYVRASDAEINERWQQQKRQPQVQN
jgi:tRNA threonylcarbamoyladenosine biosynthesis protein TsaB